jgi:multidrug transporter EmrE-like cation transporter
MAYLYLFCAFALNAAANIFIKLGSRQGFNLSTFSPLPLLASNWQFALGLLLFAINVIFYFLALRSISISVAYPIMVVMSFIIINAFALFILGERVLPIQIAGYALIVCGLFLVVRFA